MTILSLDLLIEAGLITATGRLVDLEVLSDKELSSRVSQYSNARIQTSQSEVAEVRNSETLNALFSTASAEISQSKILSSSLIYDSIILDDPLVSSSTTICLEALQEGLQLYSWAFELIRAGFIKVIPISYFNKPSNDIPLLYSEDAFRSSIPEPIYDFVHSNVRLRAVREREDGSVLVLREAAEVSRRTALNVSFENDYWISGASLYKFSVLEDGIMTWDREGKLSKEEYDRWSYQTVNEAMRARLACIYNETYLAELTGHTYVTESPFESKFLAMSGNSEISSGDISAKFLQANRAFINIDSPETIIQLRDKYSLAFRRFNYSILSVVEELSDVDPEDFERKAEILFHKEIMPQIDGIRDNLNAISSSTAKGFLASLVGISAAVATGSSLPLIPALMSSTAAGLTEAFPAISQHQKSKNKPAYIWHRITT